MTRYIQLFQLYARLATGGSFVFFGLDRVGAWGAHGEPHVSWGDWKHFMEYAKQVMSFFPENLAEVLAIVATGAEVALGVTLIAGLYTKQAAAGGGVLTLLFGISMAISFGMVSPLQYSVFAFSSSCFLLSAIESHPWSLDNIRRPRKTAMARK